MCDGHRFGFSFADFLIIQFKFALHLDGNLADVEINAHVAHIYLILTMLFKFIRFAV